MTLKVALMGEMGFIRKRKRWREGVVGREMSIRKDSSLTGSSEAGEWRKAWCVGEIQKDVGGTAGQAG